MDIIQQQGKKTPEYLLRAQRNYINRLKENDIYDYKEKKSIYNKRYRCKINKQKKEYLELEWFYAISL